MTQEKLQRGQELVRIIKEAKEFLDVINRVIERQPNYATLTLACSCANSNSALQMMRYPKVAAALSQAIASEVNQLEKEFKAL